MTGGAVLNCGLYGRAKPTYSRQHNSSKHGLRMPSHPGPKAVDEAVTIGEHWYYYVLFSEQKRYCTPSVGGSAML